MANMTPGMKENNKHLDGKQLKNYIPSLLQFVIWSQFKTFTFHQNFSP